VRTLWSRIILVPIPLTILAWALSHLPAFHATLTLWIFGLGVVAMVPLAARIAAASDALTSYLGERIGGLIDVTFDDIPELTFGIGLLIQAGLHASNAVSVATHLAIVRSLLLGTIINNVLFTLGLAILPAALRHGPMRFRTSSAKHFFAILGFALVGLSLPTLATTLSGGRANSAAVDLSVSFSLILLVCYVAYLAFTVFRFRDVQERVGPSRGEQRGDQRSEQGTSGLDDAERQREQRQEELEELEDEQEALEEQQEAVLRRAHPRAVWRALAGLGLAILVTAAIGGILVSVTDSAIQQTPLLTPLSVGFIVFPFVCNLGVQAGAIEEAWRYKMHDALAIAAGSAVQVAVFVAPLLVLLSVLLGKLWGGAAPALTLTLIFPPVQLVLLGLAVLIFATITLHGRTTWFEGLQLLAIYLLIALVTFAVQ
jgi:Ca2+:H+ antiporter